MTKVLVLYYSSYGHIEQMARAVAEGAGAGAAVTIKRVPETVPEDIARASHFKLEQDAPLATPAELPDYDAILFGTPTRFGNMASSMRAFLDQTGQIWLQGGLVGKVGSVFTSTATGGGNESTILTFWPYLAHQGMIIVGLPYTSQGLLNITGVRGGSPYGAATIAGPDGARQPTALELQMAREQGRHVAEIAAKLRG